MKLGFYTLLLVLCTSCAELNAALQAPVMREAVNVMTTEVIRAEFCKSVMKQYVTEDATFTVTICRPARALDSRHLSFILSGQGHFEKEVLGFTAESDFEVYLGTEIRVDVEGVTFDQLRVHLTPLAAAVSPPKLANRNLVAYFPGTANKVREKLTERLSTPRTVLYWNGKRCVSEGYVSVGEAPTSCD